MSFKEPLTQVDLYLLNISLVKDNLSFVHNYVSKERKEKALKFVNEQDQLLSLGAGYLMKKYLPNEEILETKFGKPYLKNGAKFNASHSGEFVVLAIHEQREVGVDIERIDEKKIDAIKFVLSDKEKDVTDTNTLFQMWSNKESLIKCLSTGIKDIKIVEGLPLEGYRTINNEEYFVKSMIYNGYSLSVSLKGKESFNIIINQVVISDD